MVELAKQSGLQVRTVPDQRELEAIFIERLSEFMAQMFVSRALTAGGGIVFSTATP
jgi:hypothetical protein